MAPKLTIATVCPPRHPRGCLQNMLRVEAWVLYKKGVPLAEIKKGLAPRLCKLADHNK